MKGDNAEIQLHELMDRTHLLRQMLNDFVLTHDATMQPGLGSALQNLVDAGALIDSAYAKIAQIRFGRYP